MSDNQDTEQKVIAAFKGFINSCRLEPVGANHSKLRPNYRSAERIFKIDNKNFILFCEVRLRQRICEILGRLFPRQINDNLVSRLLIEATTKWIESGNNPNDQLELEEAGWEFISAVSNEIRPWLVYIPLEGVKIKSVRNIPLGRCRLYAYDKNSELMQIKKQHEIRGEDNDDEEAGFFKRVTAFFRCEITGHPQKAIVEGIEEANVALNVLRLYTAFSYHHEHQGTTVFRMGLAGTLHLDEMLRVFCISPDLPILDQYPGIREQWKLHDELQIDDEFIQRMMENGLERINELYQSLDSSCPESANDITRRLLRAITWFAKGTCARSIADSFLMYAIAIEGLLSEGRTSQETYATQIAALITCRSRQQLMICPVDSYISTQFALPLQRANTLTDEYGVIRGRILELFDYRNRIAHGAILEHEIDATNLLDFETVVKNAILSFVNNGWDSLDAFKNWVNGSVNVRYDFTPQEMAHK